ncbi:MAG: peptidyl-prolyl cis-trans isomerase [Deltaproteobacteria bacterium]|nr:peptidyl-prolyl cis-trans isomerase [Deltaproteobacteria bacterium]
MKRRARVCRVLVVVVAAAAVWLAGCGEKKAGTPAGAGKKPAAGQGVPDGLTPEQAAKVVARVGDAVITVGDVTRQINRLSPYIRRRWAAPEKRKEFLDKLIRVELLAQEAQRLGLGEDPEVQRTVKQVMIRLMIKNDLEKNVLPVSVDEGTLKTEYDKEIDKYKRPAQVRASHIVVKTREAAAKLIADIKAHTDDGRYFRDKAAELSLDEKTKGQGGDLGYFSRPEERRPDEPEVPKAVAEAAWKIANVNELAPEPVEAPGGFSVVRLTNKKPALDRSFESVKRLIENRLLRDKRGQALDDFVADLRKKAKVEITAENLDKVVLPPEPPPMPGMGMGFPPPGAMGTMPGREPPPSSPAPGKAE